MRPSASSAILCVLMLGSVAGAEESGEFIRLTGGSAVFHFRTSNRDDEDLLVPSDYYRSLFSPTASVYGIPVSLEVLLSSIQSQSRQSVNFFHLESRPSESSSAPGALAWIRRLGIGTNNVSYTPFTISGRAIAGFDTELYPGGYYLSATAGRLRRSIPRYESDDPVFERYVYAVRTGYGPPEGSHLHVTLLRGWDDAGSIELDDDAWQTPADNWVGSAEGTWHYDRLRVRGELAYCLFTADRRAPGKEYEDTPGWVLDMLKPNVSSHVDMAASLSADFGFGETSLHGGFKRVGTGFRSVGNPNLQNDRLEFDTRVSRRFLERQLTLGLYYRRNSDNLVAWKDSQTVTQALGARATITPRGLPYLIIGYAPTFREVGGGGDYGTDCRMVSTTAGYTHREGSVRYSTNGTYSLQTNSGGASEDYTGHTVSLREIVALPSDLSLTGAVTFHRSSIDSVDHDRYVYDASARYTLPSHWSATGGFTHTSAQLGARKTTLRLGATTPAVGGLLTVDAEGEYTDFRSDVEEGYIETAATVTATVVW